MNTTQLKDFALLAEASYAHFQAVDYKDRKSTQDRLSTYASMNNATFSVKQAELFTNDYTLLHQSQEGVPSGFSATVFKDNANPNRLVLSFRGTEQA